MQVCITGANGFIGHCLVLALLRQGKTVRVLTRKIINIFPDNVQVVIGDLTKPDCPLDELMKGCDILFHCAGELRDESIMRVLHVVGTKLLLEAVEREYKRTTRKIHWVQLSSVGAYGPPVGGAETTRVVTENTLTRPNNEYEISKTMSDDLVIQAGKSNSMTYTILRPANVFGSAMTNQSLRRLIQMIKRKLFFYVGKPGAITTYVHVDDVVNALIACGFNFRAIGQTYNLSSDCSLEQLVKYISYCAQVKEPAIRIPQPLARVVVALVSGALSFLVRVPSIKLLVFRTNYPTDKIETELGFKFKSPMPNGVKDLVAEIIS